MCVRVCVCVRLYVCVCVCVCVAREGEKIYTRANAFVHSHLYGDKSGSRFFGGFSREKNRYQSKCLYAWPPPTPQILRHTATHCNTATHCGTLIPEQMLTYITASNSATTVLGEGFFCEWGKNKEGKQIETRANAGMHSRLQLCKDCLGRGFFFARQHNAD